MSDIIDRVPGSSPNFRTELAKKIAEIAPEAVKDGKLDVESLKVLIDGDYEAGKERFGLTWPGKAAAMRAAQEPTTATLIPDVENSKDWDTTQNVFIEGDNLEVLKILQRHYYNKIKLIYIDPPYNTGKDFIYPDNFKEGLQTYLEWTKQVNEEGKKLSSNTETEGRYHSNWLNMMYPRLKLARNLLTDDGVILVSIDDNEVANLRIALDQIFGAANFIETYVWESTFRPDNSSRIERENAQYVIAYARNRAKLGPLLGGQKKSEGLPSLTMSKMPIRTIELDPKWVDFSIPDGSYGPGDLGGGYALEDEVIVQDGKAQRPFKLTGRIKWTQQYLDSQAQEGTRIVIKGNSFVPYSKKVETASLPPTSILPRDEVGDILAANADIRGLFGDVLFDFPKPVSLIKFLIRAVTHDDPEAVVLDFFCGSGTTAHALMELNVEDGGRRSFIQVQLPEPVDAESAGGRHAIDEGFKTISQLSIERIRRAGMALDDQSKGQGDHSDVSLDSGFRTFHLSETNFERWNIASGVDRNQLEEHLFDLRDSAHDDAEPIALLTELLLKLGFALTESIHETQVGGLQIFDVSDGLLLAYMDENVKPSLDQLRAIADQGPAKIVVLEDAFHGDDELKTNLKQLCTARDIELWTA